MRHESNRLGPVQQQALQSWLTSLLFDADGKRIRSQRDLAGDLGISQSLVSSILKGAITTLGTARTMIAHIGGNPDVILGTRSRGKYAGRDQMPMRGEALDLLSAVYDEDFLLAVQRLSPPPASEAWSLEQWVEHVVFLRGMWRSGKFRAAAHLPPRGEVGG